MHLSRLGLRLALVLFLALIAAPAGAQGHLKGLLDAFRLDEVFPGADRLGPIEGDPPAAAAYAGDRRLGWVFVTSDATPSLGYSGKPIHMAVGVSESGAILGLKLLKHSEPIVLIGIPEQRIHDAIAGLIGHNVLEQSSRRRPPVDIVSGATVTLVVMGESVTRGALRVLRAHAAAGPAAATAGPARTVDMSQSGTRSWPELLGDGSVRRLHLSLAEVNEAFAKADERAAARPERGEPDETFIDLYATLVSAPVIGRSLLGEQGYARLRQRIGDDGHALLVMAEGRYSFRGSGFVRGGLFDRIELDQGDISVRFRDKDYTRLGDLAAAEAPRFPEIGLFVIPPAAGFGPTEPWRLQLLVQRAVAALDKVYLTFDLAYELPEHYLLAPPPAPPPGPAVAALALAAEADDQGPLWQRMWRDNLVGIGVLTAGLVLLTAIFFFQDFVVRRPRLDHWLRIGFLAFTLFWLGWMVNAQLSVVNVLTITSSLITEFSWDQYLLDPLLFILWSAVAVALLFWGRGAFCGWLCPFGALQEFVNRLGRWLHLPQVAVPWGLNERLWPIKYMIFLGLFGVSLYSLVLSERLAEVEPFKTAIVLKFLRTWPFVLYALVLVGAGLFVERFFCRYLCPLGAALAIPARLRMFDWLKRHRECGAPCQRCAIECPVQAIHPNGHINPNECIYCMHCQSLYWDEQRCPAMIQRRLRRERAQAMSAPRRAATAPIQPATAPARPNTGG